jgi:hypothetical protein
MSSMFCSKQYQCSLEVSKQEIFRKRISKFWIWTLELNQSRKRPILTFEVENRQ